MSHRERILTAVDLKEPDSVPITDLALDPPIIEKVTGTKIEGFSVVGGSHGERAWENGKKEISALIKACRKLDFDAVNIEDYVLASKTFSPKFIDATTFIDEWGRILKTRSDTKTTWWIGGTINTPEDLESWHPPDHGASGRMELLEYAIKEAEEDMAVMGYVHIAFHFAWQLRGGLDKFIKDIYLNPTFARKLLDKVFSSSFELAKMMMEAGVDLIAIGDDYADTHGPLLSPKLFKEYELPYVRVICNEARKRGVPIWKHSDGNLYPIIEDLIDAGISGLHPIEPPVMDLADVKERYGDKIFLAGNVDCRYVLPYGSEEDVRREVRRCIDAAARGGGYILTSSNSLHANVKVENIYAMVNEARKYGQYRKL
jgi:uroporphyrinogen decarboxylase